MRFKSKPASLATAIALGISAIAFPMKDSMKVSGASISPYVDYAKALQYSLYLYDANMCGSIVSENSALSWRGDCHTQDGKAPLDWRGEGQPQGAPSTVNVDGGFHDAGDHVKYVNISAQAFSTLVKARIAFPNAFIKTEQDKHLQKLLDYECDFLMKCIVYDNSGKAVGFVYQVADGNAIGEDHQYWAPPETQGNLRRTAFASRQGSPDALYLLNKTKEIYHNSGSSEMSQRLSKAIQDLQSLGGKSPLSMEGNYAPEANHNVNVTPNSAVNPNPETSYNGNAELKGWDWGKLRWTCNYMFEDLCQNRNWGNAAATMDFIFGNNDKSQCFVTGYYNTPTNVGNRSGVISPQNAHHRAMDGNVFTSTTDNPGVYHDVARNHGAQPTKFNGDSKNILIGALVGGPDGNGVYQYVDNQCDYVCNEVALDFNAGFVGSLAGLYEKYGAGCSIANEADIPGVIVGKANTAFNPIDKGSEPETTTSTTTTTTTEATTTTVTTTTVIIPSYIPGDVNYDNSVDIIDLTIMRIELPKGLKLDYLYTPFNFNGDSGFSGRDLTDVNKFLIGREENILQ